jgi:CubicO group peptidase (beta-lactamase class C family)
MIMFNFLKNKLLNSLIINLILIFFAATNCGSAANQVNNDLPFQKTRNKIEQQIKEAKNIPSISVAIAKNGEIIWEESFGFSDVEKSIKATPNTMYHLGSLGKVYTATAIMILKERGFINLDKPANEYLGDAKLYAFEGNADDATVRRILNHTSGLPYFWTHLYEEELDQRPIWDEVISQYGKIVSPPGDRFIYSNLGFGILGHIIERLSGKPYHEFMRNEVFEPLGLNRTMIDPGRPYNEIYLAQKYAPEGRAPYSDHICKGGGTVFASAHDLVRFGMFHLKNHAEDMQPILSDQSIDDMQNSKSANTPYGIGWHSFNKFRYKIVLHGGHVLGSISSLRLIPSENIAVAVVSNGEEADTPKICDWLFAELLTRYNAFFKIREAFSGENQNVPGRFSPPASLIGTWRGSIKTYMGDLSVQVMVKPDGDMRMKYVTEEDSENEGVPPLEGQIPRFANAVFHASFPLEVPTSFTNRYSHSVNFHLKLRGNILSGYISAEAWEPLKPHFCVPFYMRIERVDKQE